MLRADSKKVKNTGLAIYHLVRVGEVNVFTDMELFANHSLFASLYYAIQLQIIEEFSNVLR